MPAQKPGSSAAAMRERVKFRPDVKPASRSDLARSYAVNLTRSVGRIALKNRRRTSDVVDSEYNSGEWGRLLAERPWLRAKDLEDFLVGHDAPSRLAKVDGQIVRIATRDYYRYRI